MNIIVTESEDFSQKALSMLSKIGEVKLLDIKDKKQLVENIKEANVLFIRLRHYFDKQIIDSCPDLKFILTATTGLDHINIDYFESNGGKVVSLRGEYDFLGSIPSTAEHTWGLLLALMRNIPKAIEDVKNGFWRRDLFKGNNLKSKKIGILGFGRVGKQVAKFAEVFGMEVGFYDIEKKENNKYIRFDNPKDLFSWADIVSIHIPLNQKNIHYIDKELLDSLKNDVVLINTSRGPLIDELYLCRLIRANKIKGYATDVLENEINSKSNILGEQLVMLAKQGYNVIITPHIAGATLESMEMTENYVVKRFLEKL